MSTPRAFTASITHDDPFAAGREAAEELLTELGEAPELVLAHVAARLAPARVIEGLYSLLPGSTRVVGCSSDCEISSEGALTGTVTALGLRLGGIRAEPFIIAPSGRSSLECGQRAGEALAPLAPDLVIAFPDVLQMNATQFLLGMQGALGRGAPIVGGAPADHGEFRSTTVFADRTVLSGAAAGVALKGATPIRLATAARSGYEPISMRRTCTRVESGNVILEIDGRPALDVYCELLGARAAEMPGVTIEFPVGVVGGALGTQRQADEGLLLVRAIFRADEARRALVLGGDIPEGAEIRITRATRADVIRGAEEATAAALAALPDPDLAFFFSCFSRKQVLGPRYKEECAAAFARLPPGLPKLGFYTFGELSPYDGATTHHESTFTVALAKLWS